jgi:hypothetical protein
MVRRYTIVLAVLCATTAYAQKNAVGLAPPPSPATVTGAVTNSSGAPLNGAEVRLIVAGTHLGTSRTRDDGRFSVAGELKGRSKLQIRRIGFQSREVELFLPRDTTRVVIIELEATAEQLANVEIIDQSEETSEWLKEFYARRKSNGVGHYFTRKEIGARSARFLSDVLRTVPAVTLSSSRRGGHTLRMRGCRYPPLLWIDGGRVPHAELDEMVRVDDVAAMEVYPTMAGVPAQYLDRSNVGCGTILIWTRQE